jgi:hypothetical protein
MRTLVLALLESVVQGISCSSCTFFAWLYNVMN